jgi:hypothetical protein
VTHHPSSRRMLNRPALLNIPVCRAHDTSHVTRLAETFSRAKTLPSQTLFVTVCSLRLSVAEEDETGSACRTTNFFTRFSQTSPDHHPATISDMFSRDTFFPEMVDAMLLEGHRPAGRARDWSEGATISQAHFSEFGKPLRARGYFCPELGHEAARPVFIPELSAGSIDVKLAPHTAVYHDAGRSGGTGALPVGAGSSGSAGAPFGPPEMLASKSSPPLVLPSLGELYTVIL